MGGEFAFEQGADVNETIKLVAKSLAGTIGTDISNVKCKGVKFYFVDEHLDIMMASGLYVDGFHPDNYDE